jgi:hypothetical protein
MKNKKQHDPFFRQRRHAAIRRMSTANRMLAGYVGFFAVALLIFDAVIVLSLLP